MDRIGFSYSGTGADFTVTAAATGFSKFGAGSEDETHCQ